MEGSNPGFSAHLPQEFTTTLEVLESKSGAKRVELWIIQEESDETSQRNEKRKKISAVQFKCQV